MKSIIRSIFLILGVLAAVSVTGNAQISRQYSVNVPFDFTVGDNLMRSGDYRLRPLDGVTDRRTLALENLLTGQTLIIGQVSLTSSGANKQGSLTFAKTSGGWTLTDISTPTFGLGLKFKDRNETNVATAEKPVTTRTVAIGR